MRLLCGAERSAERVCRLILLPVGDLIVRDMSPEFYRIVCPPFRAGDSWMTRSW